MKTVVVTKEEIEVSKRVEFKVIDKDLYENAKVLVEIHRPMTGKKPEVSAMDTVRLTEVIDSEKLDKSSLKWQIQKHNTSFSHIKF